MLTLNIFHRDSIKRRIVAFIALGAFSFNSFALPVERAYAQESFILSAPGTRINLSPAFAPPLLKGVKVYPDNPFRLDFILDKGNSSDSNDQLKSESTRLIKYFLASITVPEKDLWVNLSPYEKDRIVPNAFGVTEMGRDLLAQDYLLKQITASVIYPEGEVGKAFWSKVYAEAQKQYGTSDVPIDTFNKVWIVPEKAVVYESKSSAYVVESRLKVMLDADYLALEKNNSDVKEQLQTPATNKLGSDIIREIVIPILEKEVNEGQNFAQLRQVYNSLILAVWYKDKIKESLLGKAYVDQEKTGGVDIDDKAVKDKIWAQYVEVFKKGVYNYIKEEYDPVTQETVSRKYFSGGAGFDQIRTVYGKTTDQERLPSTGVLDHAMIVTSNLKPFDNERTFADQEVDGFLFKPREEVMKDDPRIYDGVRSSLEVRKLLLQLKKDGRRLKIRLPVRALDGPGSGIDKEDRRNVITKRGALSFEDIPATPTFAHEDLYVDISIEAANDPEVTEYVSDDYGFPADNPFTLKGPLGFIDGKVVVRKGLASAGAYIFQNLFGISGVRITAQTSHPVILAGSVESSSVFLGACLMAASILKGADWSFADIYHRAWHIENEIFEGATGGQGHFPYALGGVFQNVWLSGITDGNGNKVFGDEVFSRQIVKEEDYPFYESRLAFVQLGKEFKDGEYVHPRTAEVTSVMGRDLLIDRDPVGLQLYQERIELAHQFSEALRDKDMPTVIKTVERYMEIRDEVNYRWFEVALMKEGEPGRPAYAERYAHFLNTDPLLIKFYQEHGDALKRISLYSYYSKEIIESAKKYHIGLFMVGGGGSNANAVAFADDSVVLAKFLKENGIELFNIDEASRIARGTGILKGYMPFKIGGHIEFSKEFLEYGLKLPLFPVPAKLSAVQGDVSIIPEPSSHVAVNFDAMLNSLPTAQQIHDEPDDQVRVEMESVVANIISNLSSIRQKVERGEINLDLPIRLNEDEEIPNYTIKSKVVKLGVAVGTLDPVHWGHINFWLEFINKFNCPVVVSPNGDIKGYKDDKLTAEVRHRLVKTAIAPFAPLLNYSPVGLDNGNLLPMAQGLKHVALNSQADNLQVLFLSGSDALERHAKVAETALQGEFAEDRLNESAFQFVLMPRTEFPLSTSVPSLKVTGVGAAGLEGTVRGFKRIFPVTVIGDPNTLSSSIIRKEEKARIYLPGQVQKEIVGRSLYVNHKKASARWMHTTHDVREGLVKELSVVLGDRYGVADGGFGTIDISLKGVDKGVIIEDVFLKNDRLETVYYFGNEFNKSGNDVPILLRQETLRKLGKNVVVFSVDGDPFKRTKDVRDNTIWIGAGPEATGRVMKIIADAIENGGREVTINGQGMDAHKSVRIQLEHFVKKSMMLFDVDGTLLVRREDSFSSASIIRTQFVRLLDKLPLGIASANARIKQTARIVPYLMGNANLVNLILYVNGGATRVSFNDSGSELIEQLFPSIPELDVEKIRKVVIRRSAVNFGLNEKEMSAWKKWFNFNGEFGVVKGHDDVRFRNVRFLPWWNNSSFMPDIIDDDILDKSRHALVPLYLTEPYLVNKDGVQISITILPKILDIEPDAAMATNTGGIDLTRDKVGLQVRNEGDGVQFEFDSSMIQQLQDASGFSPVVIDIQLMTVTLPVFLGVKDVP